MLFSEWSPYIYLTQLEVIRPTYEMHWVMVNVNDIKQIIVRECLTMLNMFKNQQSGFLSDHCHCTRHTVRFYLSPQVTALVPLH